MLEQEDEQLRLTEEQPWVIENDQNPIPKRNILLEINHRPQKHEVVGGVKMIK